jgi:hypothetical protein
LRAAPRTCTDVDPECEFVHPAMTQYYEDQRWDALTTPDDREHPTYAELGGDDDRDEPA